MTGYCALPSHFRQASLTPNHILKTASLTGGCSPWVLLHYFTRLNTMLWTPDCPRIACWQAVPLARVEGGFNCVGMSIGHAHTRALYRNCQKYTDISHKYQNRNTKHSLHHLPISSPSQQELFSFCFPLANVNSRSTNTPIVNFLPTPIAKKKAKHPVWSFLNTHQKSELLDISELLQIFCKPHQLSHLLVIISNNIISSSSGP